jgi:PAS domain S-box-containing protein
MFTMRNNQALDQLLNLALPRLEMLWKRANTVPEEQEALMWESLDQLSNAFEEVYAVMEELHLRTEELEVANLALKKEYRRYQDLFEFAPCGYVVTDLYTVIQEANEAAANLLNIPQRFYLVGKPLNVFIAQENRCAFQTNVNQLQTGKEVKSWEIQLQPRQSKPFPVICTATAVRDSQEEVIGFRWLLQDLYKEAGQGLLNQEEQAP